MKRGPKGPDHQAEMLARTARRNERSERRQAEMLARTARRNERSERQQQRAVNRVMRELINRWAHDARMEGKK